MEAATSLFACSNLCWEFLLPNIITEKRGQLKANSGVNIQSSCFAVPVGTKHVDCVNLNFFICKVVIIILSSFLGFEDEIFKKHNMWESAFETLRHYRKCEELNRW